jgi:penicillin-binding protein 1A
VLPQLDTLIDETVEPIDVWTTLDLGMQRAGDQAVNANTPRARKERWCRSTATGRSAPWSAARTMSPPLQSRDPGHASARLRFKLFVYLAALEAGHTPNDTVVDEPVNINGWSPRTTAATIRARSPSGDAFSFSINSICGEARPGEVGLPDRADMAQRYRDHHAGEPHPSMVLGTSDVG